MAPTFAFAFFFSLLSSWLSQAEASAQEVIQAQVPPRTDFSGFSCKQIVFEHSFASSYGVPYVAFYTPPNDCSFTTTIFNLSVTSKGRQYDRLALLFFGDTEIWRTSTAMPSQDGIFWSYQKDMTVFDKLLRKEQKVIFDLSNVFNDLYTGAFNVTIEALYYDDKYISPPAPPDQIFPISALASSRNVSSVMSLPDDNGTVSVLFPRNVETAIISLIASGNGAEEFWFTNVPTEYVSTFPENPGWLYGYSPFREVQLLIDGDLAGVSWPFPLLFTGGVDPGLWRPIVGIDSYDLPTFEIDITPWLPVLCDGKSHDISLKVVAFDSSAGEEIGTIGENWWVTGSIFVWLDGNSNQTTGSVVKSSIMPPSFDYQPILTTAATNVSSSNSSFYFSLSAQRSLSISATIHTSAGSRNVSWSQSLSYTNVQNMTSLAYNQSLALTYNGSYSSSISPVKTTYSYPLNLYSAYVIAPNSSTLSSVLALIDRSKISSGVKLLEEKTRIKGSEASKTRQSGWSHYSWNETIVEGTSDDRGELEQWFSYTGKPRLVEDGVHAFSRHLKEKDDKIVIHEEQWETMDVPSTEPLPYVEGEPLV